MLFELAGKSGSTTAGLTLKKLTLTFPLTFPSGKNVKTRRRGTQMRGTRDSTIGKQLKILSLRLYWQIRAQEGKLRGKRDHMRKLKTSLVGTSFTVMVRAREMEKLVQSQELGFGGVMEIQGPLFFFCFTELIN
jgi:hypothetical protein